MTEFPLSYEYHYRIVESQFLFHFWGFRIDILLVLVQIDTRHGRILHHGVVAGVLFRLVQLLLLQDIISLAFKRFK